MRIAHLADMHWGMNYPGPSPESRFEDISRTMDWTADRIIEEKCNLVLVAGDAFKDSRVFLDRASLEIKAFATWLRKISAAGIDVVAISGTPSHDAVAAYELIKEMRIPKVVICTTPDIVKNLSVSVACIPGLNRSGLVTQEEYRTMSAAEVHRIMTGKITQLAIGMRAQCNGIPILMTHMAYQGADTGYTDLMMQNEPVLMQEATTGYSLACLGHIHRPQQIGENVFYSGSPERLSFSDEHIKTGFWIHEHNGNGFDSRFIETPARKYCTLNVDFSGCEDLEKAMLWELAGIRKDTGEELLMFPTTGAITRLRYKCTREQVELISRKFMEATLYKGGAYYVSDMHGDVEHVDRARDREVTESLGPVEALEKWAQKQGIVPEEITELQSMTAGLLEVVQ